MCVPRAPPSKTAFDTVNTNLHRRVRCAALGPITKSSQGQRNSVLTVHRHTAKTKNCRHMEKQSCRCAWPHINETNGGPRTIAGTLASILGLLEKSDMLFLGTTRVVVVRMLLGLGAFACDMGITFDFRLWSDSSVAKFVIGKVSWEFSSTCRACVRKTR